MKFTLSWLKDHLETDASLEAILKALTMVGLEVEKVEDFTRDLAAFKAARVIEAQPHPNADKLRLCRVEAEDGEHQVVCGAPNARTGMVGVFAPVGSFVPGIALELKPAKIRGVDSRGMLVSEREMGLSDEHEGIIELAEGTPVGTPIAEVLGLDDPMIEIAITPNRPDCLGVHGVARDLAAAGLGTLKDGSVAPVPGAFPCPLTIRLDFADEKVHYCPVFAGRVVRGVKTGPSPDWLQRRLHSIGLRPINTLVDITNYISYDRGRPLHVYDAARLTGDIGARPGRRGETFLALDGKDYAVDEEMCVIADEAGVLGLGGIMGGEASGSTEATTDVFIESAYFDPIATAMTGRRLNILSDARYRFERGVDPGFVLPGLELATRMILDLCGGEASEVVVAGEVPDTARQVVFDTGLVRRLTAIDIDETKALGVLAALGFDKAGESEAGHPLIAVPSWRPDITGAADLVEEVTRIEGLHEVPSTPLPRAAEVPVPCLTARQNRARLARRALAVRGLDEAVTWSFIPPKDAALFGGDNAVLRLDNPISADMAAMRPSVLAGLMAAASRNQDRGQKSVGLFEVGPAYAGQAPEDQRLVAAGVVAGPAPRHWRGVAGGPEDAVFTAKAHAEAALGAAGAPLASAQVSADAPAWYHPGRSGVFRLGKNVLAAFGEVHPRIVEAFDLDRPVAAFEVFLDAIPEPKRRAAARPALDAPDLLPVERDFAFLVDRQVAAAEVVRAAAGADKKLITEVSVFDVYEGKGVPEGQKSLAIAVRLQPRDKTMTDEEIDAVSAKVVAQVEKATGGSLRS